MKGIPCRVKRVFLKAVFHRWQGRKKNRTTPFHPRDGARLTRCRGKNKAKRSSHGLAAAKVRAFPTAKRVKWLASAYLLAHRVATGGAVFLTVHLITIRSRLIIGVWKNNHIILRSFGFLHPKAVQYYRKLLNYMLPLYTPRFPFVKVAGKGGNCILNVRGSAILWISIERFGRSTMLPPLHDAVRNRVSTSMPGMNATHLLAPVVAYKCVLQPVLCRFSLFPTKNAPSQQNIWDIFNQEIWFKLYHICICY